jgi:plastocyanin
MSTAGLRGYACGAVLALLTAACGGGGGGDAGPSTALSKPAAGSGDLQSGPVGEALPEPLRVVVTRDGQPVPDVTVTWSTASGTLAPATAQTDANGESNSVWTLGTTAGAVTATARVTDATGSPQTFTATADDGTGGTIVQVLTAGGTRFVPAGVSIAAGQTVTWVWGAGSTAHNIVPDAGGIPASSGTLASAPHTYAFTFATPGVYHYHCQAHGAAGGIGMSGTVTVTP